MPWGTFPTSGLEDFPFSLCLTGCCKGMKFFLIPKLPPHPYHRISGSFHFSCPRIPHLMFCIKWLRSHLWSMDRKCFPPPRPLLEVTSQPPPCFFFRTLRGPSLLSPLVFLDLLCPSCLVTLLPPIRSLKSTLDILVYSFRLPPQRICLRF